jgi:hypothetical protein
VVGPIASLLDYHASPVRRFWLFIIPEFIGFTCAGIMMVYYGRSREKSNHVYLLPAIGFDIILAIVM